MRLTQKETEEFISKHNVRFENNKWFGERICSDCGKQLLHYASIKRHIIRNIRDAIKLKQLCSSCSTSGNKNPFFGKSHSIETKQKVSKSRMGKACGANNSMNNPINRQKISDSLKEKYKNGELNFLKIIQRDKMIESHSMGKLKTCPISKFELEIQSHLIENKINFEPQFKISSKPFDFFVKKYNLLVEFNGDYFHANPEKYEANYFNVKKKMFAWELWKQDEEKKKEAIDSGYNYLIIWEKDYKKNKSFFINKIVNYDKK